MEALQIARRPKLDETVMAGGRPVRIGPLIGEGGQGAVFSVSGDPGACVKIYFESDPSRQTALRRRFDALLQKGLRADRRLVLPTAVLELPWTGYLMRRVQDAEPLSALAVPPRSRPVNEWFCATGGLRRRLIVGHALAEAFSALHLSGLSYGDLSWENVLIPSRGRPEVSLIDCDNLSVTGVPPSGIQGTPWFIGPEVVREHQAPDAVSDQHALAVLLFHMLVLAHPLLGDAVRAADPEAEQAALSGRWPFSADERLPWIDHPEDDRNRSSVGLPRDFVLSRMMTAGFQAAFGPGLLGPDRIKRPTPGRWADTIGRAVDATVSCGCRQTFYLSAKACPWCDAARPPHWVLLCEHGDGRRPVVVQKRRRLFARHLRRGGDTSGGTELMTVHAGSSGAELEVHAETVFRSKGGSETRLDSGRRPLADGDRFRLAGEFDVWVEARQG